MEIVSSGIVAVPSGVSSTGLYLIQEGILQVLDGGWAQDIGLAEGGQTFVSGGGILYLCTVSSGGTATVMMGGYAQDVTVENGGLYLVSSGGTAHKSLLMSGGTQIVRAGEMAASVTVENGGVLHVSSGGYARNPVISLGGVAYAWANALIDNAQISGTLEVNANAAANSVSILDGGKLAVLTGGYAYEAKISSGGTLDISSGGRANYASVYEGGAVMVSAGASCINATISGGAVTLAGAVVPDDPEAEIIPGGFASNTTLNSGGSLIVSSGATATKVTENGGYVYVAEDADVTFTPNTFSGLVLSDASATVHAGTTATDTTVNSGGRLDVSSGGTATNIYASAGARLNLTVASDTYIQGSFDGTAFEMKDALISGYTVNTGGKLYVSSGGTATNTTVNSWGYLFVSSGGTANNTTVNSRGWLYVSSGGTASITVINSGYLYVLSAGTATNTTVNSGGYMYVSSGGTANNTTVNSNGILHVSSGGVMNSTTVNEGVLFELSNGVTADHTTINEEGELRIYSGGTANSTTVNFGGRMNVFSGGTVTGIIENGGYVNVPSDANVVFVSNMFSGLVLSYTSATVHSGTTATDTSVNFKGYLHVYSGGVTDVTTVNDRGTFLVSSGGVANSTTLNDGGRLFVSSGGTATNTTVNSWGYLFVSSGGTANNTTVNSGGYMYVSSGGTATEIKENGGYVYVAADADVTFIPNSFSDLILSRASATIHSGTTATDNTVNDGGRLFVSSGGTATNTTVNSGGYMYVSSGGTANSTTVNSRGRLSVYGDCTATEIMENGGYVYFDESANVTFAPNTFSDLVLSNASATVHSGTTANSTTVNTSGFFYIYSSGIANTTTVHSDGDLCVSSGGKMTGKMTFESGAVVSMYEGALLDFDLTQTEAGEAALVNDLSIIQGTPVYTLTVDGTEAEGVYTLAAGAADFASTITVKNTYGDDLGTLKLGEKVYIGKDDYTLTLTDDVLSVAINAPTVTEANGDVLLESAMPKARYMYGCVNTSISMILGYYDLYGYRGKDLSEVIEGDVELDTRGTGYYIYMMDDFDSVLGRANASRDYVERFFSKDPIEVINARTETETTPAEELPYSFVNDGAGPELRTDVWNCLADYLGTGQFWRGNKNLSATSPFDTLEAFLNDDTPYTVTDEATGIERTIDEKYNSCLYGLYLYVRDKGFDLDRKTTKILQADVAGGEFTFDDYRKEIDAGRPVMVLVTGHAMVGYGYNAETREIIIDNCYQSDQRMVWDGVYDFAGERTLEAICTFGFMTTDADIDLAVSSFDEDSGTAGKLIVATAEGQQESVDYCFVGSPLYLSFAVSNQGTTASGAFDIAIYCDGVKKDSIPSLTLDPEAIRRVYDIPMAADIGVGLHSISVRIDPDNAIQELYALNNSDARSVMVLKEGTNVVEGTKTVASGGVSKDDYVMNGAGIQVLEGGTAEGTLIQGKVTSRSLDGKEVKYAPGFVNVSRGGLIRNATVYEYGQLELSGTAEDIRVQEEGSAVVSDGGIVSGVFVDKKGALAVESGGKLTGRIDVASGASVGFAEGGILNFDLTGTTAGVEAFVNDLSIIQGTPVYTLTVSSEQEEGVYALAEGAESFTCSISVVNKAGDKLGTLTVGGETVFVGSTGYTLNLTDSSLTVTVDVPDLPSVPTNLAGTKDRVSWDPAGAGGYVLEYSTDDFAHALPVDTAGNAMDMLDLPAGTYQWRVRTDDGEAWAVGDEIVSDNDTTPKVLQSNADGSDDIFFAQASGTWENLYYAQHVGSVNDWSGTNEVLFMNGRNRLTDLFFGSDDANILCLTDDENGDGIFVDDEYTELPEGITEQQARIARIDEIRAGAGDDIVDMTSYRIEYTGDGLTVRGGDGNDTVWANKGDNWLFGDAGNDRIVGASGNDVIAGGIGNDRLHGGGGNDIFTFCDNWGVDEVEQLATGFVTLWFASGDESKWNKDTLTYTDGDNSIKVSGVSAEQVMLKFGDDGSDRYDVLASAGAFAEFTSQKVFEEDGKGILAGQ